MSKPDLFIFRRRTLINAEKCLNLPKVEKNAWLITKIEDDGVSMGVYDENDGLMFIDGIDSGEIKPFLQNKYAFEYNGFKLFIEPFSEKGTVYVFGAGHVSRELVPVIEHIGFKTAVWKERNCSILGAFLPKQQ